MLRLFGSICIVFLSIAYSGSTDVMAVAVDQPLTDPKLEARARTLHKELRCLVCQNQSIEDSNADLAKDLREVVREKISEGATDEETLQFVVARYGDWVLMTPPLKNETILLWLTPLLLTVIAIILAILKFRTRRSAILYAPPLTHDEQNLVNHLLNRENKP